MAQYINRETGLFGVTPNPANYSTGNPLLETAQAYVFLRLYGDYRATDQIDLTDAFNSCRMPATGFFSGKPHSIDNITHDDIIGMVAAWAAQGGYGRVLNYLNFVEWAQQHNYVLSTTGKFYWDALVKPWHWAYYILCSTNMKGPMNSSWYTLLSFVFAILVDALFNTNNTSDKKLMYLMIKSTTGESKLVDFAAKFWWKRLRKVFGSMSVVFNVYYGQKAPIFARWCNE